MANRFVLSAIIGFFIVSCAADPVHVPVSSEDSTQHLTGDTVEISWSALEADSAKPGDVLILNGYIGDIGSSVTQTNGRMTVPLFARRNQRVGFRLNLNAKVGTRPNHVNELPAEFMPEDFKILDNDGVFLTRESYVSVTAIKTETTKSGQIYANLERIYAAKTIGFLPVHAGATALTSEIIYDSSQTMIYCFIEGKLELPEIILPYSTEITLDLKNSSVPEIKTIEIPLGEGPATMNDLPDNYTEGDLIIRDYQSNRIPYGSKVKIYGAWERNAFDSGFPGKFYVEEIEVLK